MVFSLHWYHQIIAFVVQTCLNVIGPRCCFLKRGMIIYLFIVMKTKNNLIIVFKFFNDSQNWLAYIGHKVLRRSTQITEKTVIKHTILI
jgi:hypothetical protein